MPNKSFRSRLIHINGIIALNSFYAIVLTLLVWSNFNSEKASLSQSLLRKKIYGSI